MRPAPITASLSAAGLICGFAVALATGSRPLGGVVLAGFAAGCVTVWLRRDGRRLAAGLSAGGVAAFILSHILGRLIGAWPAVLLVAAVMAAASWQLSDRHHASTRLGPPATAD